MSCSFYFDGIISLSTAKNICERKKQKNLRKCQTKYLSPQAVHFDFTRRKLFYPLLSTWNFFLLEIISYLQNLIQENHILPWPSCKPFLLVTPIIHSYYWNKSREVPHYDQQVTGHLWLPVWNEWKIIIKLIKYFESN